MTCDRSISLQERVTLVIQPQLLTVWVNLAKELHPPVGTAERLPLHDALPRHAPTLGVLTHGVNWNTLGSAKFGLRRDEVLGPRPERRQLVLPFQPRERHINGLDVLVARALNQRVEDIVDAGELYL